MSRFAFNAVCSVILLAIMLTASWVLRQQSTDFITGLATGVIGTAGLLYLLHKMDVRLF